MISRIAAIAFILLCTSAGWLILGGTLEHRTYQSDDKLRSGVTSIWGSPQEQCRPSASYVVVEQERTESETRMFTTNKPHFGVGAVIPLNWF